MSDAFSEPFRRICFLGFAGHRMVPDEQAAKEEIKREVLAIRETLEGDLVGISSAAPGADLLFLEACEEVGVRTVVVLPVSREHYRESFGHPAGWERACKQLDAAWWCEVAPDAGEADHPAARTILEMAEHMLFYWDGKVSHGLGGTGETVRRALEGRIPSRVIDADTLGASWYVEPSTVKADPFFLGLPIANKVAELLKRLDERAKMTSKLSAFVAESISLNLLAILLQAALMIFVVTATGIGAVAKLLILLLAALLPWLGGRWRRKDGGAQDRIRAELLRSLMASHHSVSPLRPAGFEQFEEAGVFLRSAALRLVPERRSWKEEKGNYVRDRLDERIGQLTEEGARAEKRMSLCRRVFWSASIGAIVLGAIAVVDAKEATAFGRTLGYMGMILPGISAWSLAMISVFGFKRRAVFARQLVNELTRLRFQIESANDSSSFARAVRQVEHLLLQELWEWRAMRD